MRVLDFKGLKCPIPVLKAFKIVKEEKEINEFKFLTDEVYGLEAAPQAFVDLLSGGNLGSRVVRVN